MILQLVQNIYLSLPVWMQSEVTSWNKHSIEVGTNFLKTAINISNVKGYVISSLYIDNAAFITNKNFNELYECCMPVVASNKHSNIVIMSSSKPKSAFNELAKKCKKNESLLKYHELKYYEREEWNEEWKVCTIEKYGQRAFDIEFNCELD
jgi:hypothetical protein